MEKGFQGKIARLIASSTSEYVRLATKNVRDNLTVAKPREEALEAHALEF